MNIGDIKVNPLAAESMGTRSLCTEIITPDIHLLLDPSAALAKRNNLEPHPLEYLALKNQLTTIRTSAKASDALSISHYHFDHIRPGFVNNLYNLSTRDERRELFEDKLVFAKDNRENINPSQRRRGFYFEKDVKDVVKKIEWSDNRIFTFGETKLTFSHPLPHGSANTYLGYIVATTIEYSEKRVLFAPDVQGPLEQDSLHYILSMNPDLAILGGPPVYLTKFTKSEKERALFSLVSLASEIPILVIDHHLLRYQKWKEWIEPVHNASERVGNQVLTMATLGGCEITTYEADRQDLYHRKPPSEEFMNWTRATEEYKVKHPPPLPGLLE
ncbi:MAG: MBL fold metallo-hydrolase [Candidatus Thorarchaeota archaeon]|jgi:predicted metallo-beta-lactamase superfamily hydrolase